MSTLSLLVRGSGLRTLESIVSILVGLITLPLMMRYLGVDLYGVWVLIGSFTALLYIFDLGFASAVTRQVAAGIAQKDNQRINQIVNNALLIYSALAIVILIVVTLLALILDPDLKGALSRGDFAWILWMFGAALAIEFPVKAFSGLATGYMRYDLLSAYRIIVRLISTAVLIALLVNGFELVAIAALNAVMSVISALAYFLVAKHVFPALALSRRYWNRAVTHELYRYSAWAFLIDANQLIKNRMDIFFVGSQLSLGAVSLYYVAVRLVEYTCELLYKMLNLATPLLTQHATQNNQTAFRDDLLLFTRVNVYLSIAVLLIWMLIGERVLVVWMGDAFEFQPTYQVMLVLLIGRLSGVMVNGITSAFYANNTHQYLAKIALLETLMSLALFGLLVVDNQSNPVLGINLLTVAWAITLPLMAGRLIFVPWIALKTMNIVQPASFLLLSLRPILVVAAPVLCGLGLYDLSSLSTTIGDMSAIVLASITSVIMFFICLYFELLPREKQLLARITKRPNHQRERG